MLTGLAFILIPVLYSYGAEQSDSSGTGFIVHPDGYILTSRHVVQGADKLEVVLSDGTKHAAKFVTASETVDVALLQIDGHHLPAAILGDSDQMDVMDYVMAIGHPLANFLSGSASAYEGKINSKQNDPKFPRFQIDATINPGASGGPLVNERGEVIGIIESKLSAKQFLEMGGFLPERISFALPINYARSLIKQASFSSDVPPSKSQTKLEPKAVFNLLKPSVVLILHYGSRLVAIGHQGQKLTLTLSGMRSDAKPLELVPVGSGQQLCLMGKYEVTQAQYEGLMGENPSQFRYGANYPVESVTWEEAKQFCARLTRLLRAAIDEGGKEWPKEVSIDWIVRLPTDAEWSIAVGLENERDGTPKEKDMQIKGVYPWGTQWPPPSGAGNYGDLTCQQKYPGMPNIEGYVDGYAETAPVGSFKPNRYDLYDLGGNVWEWCEDWLDLEQKQRVARGASWRNGPPEAVLASHRGSNVPNGRFHNIGFRVVLGAAP